MNNYSKPPGTRIAPRAGLSDEQHVSLCEVLDRVLNKGVVVVGEVVISVANIDLVYLGLQLVLTSVEAAKRLKSTPSTLAVAVAEDRA